jgi:hypothetical protein
LKNILTILATGMIFISVSVFAKTIKLESTPRQTTLLELFTSEGCNSCPPADQWMSTLKHDPRLWKEIIPVAFHVDYWDYIGWKDPFATADHSYRQRRYQQQGGISTVYTPGFVSNGQEWRRWFGLKKIERSDKMPGKLSATIVDGVAHVVFDARQVTDRPLKLNIAVLGFDLEKKVTDGENAGRTLQHDFVVIGQASQISRTGQWNLPLPDPQAYKSTTKGVAFWVSEDDKQQPVQSVGGWLD